MSLICKSLVLFGFLTCWILLFLLGIVLTIGTCNCHKLFLKKNFPNVSSTAALEKKRFDLTSIEGQYFVSRWAISV